MTGVPMEQTERRPNWMNYPPLLQFYENLQAAGAELEPDPEFLKEPRLGRYHSFQLKDLELPDAVRDFLTQVGLPDRFLDHRSPNEEEEDRRSVYPGVVFWVKCLRVETVKRKRYLVIGEYRTLGRSCTTVNYGKPDRRDEWNKTEELVLVVVELSTGTVWKWVHDSFGDVFSFINSSLEQYLLSMACWRSFYPQFSQTVRAYTEQHPNQTELDYIFRHSKDLYAPFREVMEVLDPGVMRKRTGYWKFMCDLSLY